NFTPKFSIPDNDTSETPVSLELFMAAGADQARVKSLLSASAGLTTGLEQWTPAMQQNVVSALHSSCDLFIATVGKIHNLTAPAGGVCVPLKEKRVTTPVYLYGPPGHTQMLFTCPVSAMPAWVLELYAIWRMCRLARALPHAGGFLDQPMLVQRAWPIFEDEV